jgi:hypothetical protein
VSSTPRSAPPEAEAPATLSRELGELLIELSIGVHRYAMYPPGHPSLAQCAVKVGGRVAQCLDSRAVLHIAVARDRLVIEGVATDPRHPVLRDLARTLHDRQIAALAFRTGVATGEVDRLLAALARDAQDTTVAPSDATSPTAGSSEHITVHPIGYERLTLQEDGSEGRTRDRASELWLALAQATMDPGAPGAPDAAAGDPATGVAREIPDEAGLAEALRRRSSERAYDQAIAGYLRQLTHELRDDDGPGARLVRDRVSALIRQLDEPALRRVLEVGGDAATARELVLDANQTLAVDAVVKVLGAAASAAGQTVSTSMVRLLAKLSKHAQSGDANRRGRADAALRENVDQLLADWTLEDPNPKEYTQILDAMARVAPPQAGTRTRKGRDGAAGADETGERESHEHPGAIRLIQMALEVDAWGVTIEAAASELIAAGRVRRLIELMREAPPGCAAADEVRAYIRDPEHLRRLLATEEVDEEWLHVLVHETGRQAVPPLLDALADSESRSVRRRIFDSLVGLGEDLSADILPRLDDPRWFVVRNMLALIQRLDPLPAGFNPARFLRHADVRVRKEAFPLAVKDEAGRAEALAFGLASDDERLIHLALLEVQTHDLPRPLVSAVLAIAARDDHPPWLRVLAVRALRRERSPKVRDTMLDIAAPASRLFGRRKLRSETSPDVVAAVEALAERWPSDPTTADVLHAARRSADPGVRRAATPRGQP